MEIKDTAVIITGGASGMGAATAYRLYKHGAKITLLDTNYTLAQEIASNIQGQAVHCDITQKESVEQAIKQSVEKQGPPRLLINCAGMLYSRRMINQAGPMPLEDFERVISVNLIGTFNVMRIATQAMLSYTLPSPAAERGLIINTASIAAFEGQIGQTAYSASKGGIVSLTLPAARELASFNIRVVTIAPGLVDTPMFDKLSPEAKQRLSESVPFPQRLAYPDEYAFLVQHIIENPMLNGTVIRLDGALRMQAK